MSLCPSCQFLISDDEAGCEFCGRSAEEHDEHARSPDETETTTVASFPRRTSTDPVPAHDGTLVPYVGEDPTAELAHMSAIAGAIASALVGAAPESGAPYPAPYPAPWDGEESSGGLVLGSARTPGAMAGEGVTVRTGPSNMVITACFVVGITLFSLGVFLFAILT